MKELEERILKDGQGLPGGILKVDNFINHQLDPALLYDCARELARRFDGCQIDKVLTVEASGIAPAVFVAHLLNVPVVFAKKTYPTTMQYAYASCVLSFTRACEQTIFISKEYLHAGERVLAIDDFIAYGNAAKGLADICAQAGATLVGFGFLIEKAFQRGRTALLRARPGLKVESLAVITSLDDGKIVFTGEDAATGK